MAEAMGVNRTVMSNFINQTYGMNFKRYLNLRRIKEYQTLIANPSNERKSPYQIMAMAGFKDSRHFQRAIQSENTDKEQSHEEPQINKKDESRYRTCNSFLNTRSKRYGQLGNDLA